MQIGDGNECDVYVISQHGRAVQTYRTTGTYPIESRVADLEYIPGSCVYFA